MTNTQILFQFAGWAFLLILSNRTIKRTEISRLKDQLVVQIEELTTWLETELGKSEVTALKLENTYTGKVARLDLLLQQLNSLARRQVIDTRVLLPFWDQDIDSVFTTKKVDDLKAHQQNAIEKIEISYHSLFKVSMLGSFYNQYKPELFGLLLSTVIVLLLRFWDCALCQS